MKSRTALLAGLVLAASTAFADSFDQQVQITKATDNRTLTVRYAGAKVSLIELRINGVSAATRAVSDGQNSGETNFTLDTANLAEGDNKVEIRLLDEAGRIVGTEKTTVFMDRTASGPVFLAKPQSGATVQGMVEISVGFKSQMKGSYVSFFVNDEFKALKNYAPYTYLWDTNSVTNGWHEVEAWVVDEGSNTFRTERMRVFVNNPGGATKREALPKATGVEPREILKPPTPVKPVVAKPPVVVKPSVPKPVATKPAPPALEVSVNEVRPVVAKVAATKSAPVGKGVMTNVRVMRPTGNRTAGTVPVTGNITAPKIVVKSDKPQVSKPSKTAVPAKLTVPPKPAEVVALHKPAEIRKPVMKITEGTKLPNIGYYPITVNGRPVKFDVMPRVVSGIALTPFRHLFEHAGGKVGWNQVSKSVEAKGMGNDVQFQIGLDYAMVNGGRVSFEHASFLEQGRAIVPLSFVQGLLKVDVHYDPATKHVLITKSK